MTIVEQLNEIGMQVEAMTKKIILSRLKKNNVTILTEHRLSVVKEEGVLVMDKNGREFFVPGDRVIMAVGNRPVDTLFEQVRELGIEVYSIGDCLEVRSAKEALYEGARIGRSI